MFQIKGKYSTFWEAILFVVFQYKLLDSAECHHVCVALHNKLVLHAD